MKSVCKLAAVSALAAAFVSPVLAASSASASLTNLSVTLIDLNLMDGVAPTLTWSNSNYYGSYVYGYANDGAHGNYPSFTQYGITPFGNVSGAAITALSNSVASVSEGNGATPFDGASLSAGGFAAGTSTASGVATSSFYGYAYAPYSSYNAFTLSANTLAIFKATGSVSASTTVGYDGLGSEFASSAVQLYVQGNTSQAGGSGNQYAYDNLNASASYSYQWNQATNSYDYLPFSNSSARGLSVSFVNLSTGDLTGQFQSYVSASGSSSIAAVPEPESYAMLLAGLGLIGAIARRCRQN